jgi:hypothetical protein
MDSIRFIPFGASTLITTLALGAAVLNLVRIKEGLNN